MINEDVLITESFEGVLGYTNEDVLSRFMDMYRVDEEEATDIFQETKKFLYICRLPGIFIPDHLLIIDEMWHNSILFTREYQCFCDRYFGSYIHHLPASKKEKELQIKKNSDDPGKATEEFREKLGIMLNTVYDVLGEETLLKWFKIYPGKYSKVAITALRRY